MIALLGCARAVWPVLASAQPVAALPAGAARSAVRGRQEAQPQVLGWTRCPLGCRAQSARKAAVDLRQGAR